jgi:hypothetical protein
LSHLAIFLSLPSWKPKNASGEMTSDMLGYTTELVHYHVK